ncbi:hypothetical protein PAE3550 [Pyrobaculum aerophilum str. IM2]|uniref:Uncharacterized protein n=2 Tax=Pyrobaculum aerophilum TaxID=13773 RepID=Q8ZSW7_PYRAE|nr:hypothetical protein PAE3550 [Pyrobaculum aerophilum str. IM2]HII47849.1 hypothetical protein [Pyrobaculum aerophilum]
MATHRWNLSKTLLSITSSPGVRAITITAGDRILASHLYAKSSYAAVVTRERECVITSEELKKATWLLSRLMDRVGSAVKSRYYTYTGPLEISTEGVIFKPYVTPTSTAEIIFTGKFARVKAGDFKKKYRTSIEIGEVLRRHVQLLENC